MATGSTTNAGLHPPFFSLQSDQSAIIALPCNELTFCRDLIDVTLAVENANLKNDHVTDVVVGVEENMKESLLTPGSLENAWQQSCQKKATD